MIEMSMHYFRFLTTMTMSHEVDTHFLPNEIWLRIFSFLDLNTQKLVGLVNKTFLSLIDVVWKTQVMKLLPSLSHFGEDLKGVKLRVVMDAYLKEKRKPVAQFQHADLFDILSKYKTLLSCPEIKRDANGYDFFHDYSLIGCKFLELYQKWPRPGAKSLEKFVAGNKERCKICWFFVKSRINEHFHHYSNRDSKFCIFQ